MTPEAQQTRQVVAFLAASCDVCLVPCDPEIHAATLRLKEPPFQPQYGPRMIKPAKDGFDCVTPGQVTCKCGAVFESLNPRLSRRCPQCARKAGSKSLGQWNKQRRRKIVTD